MGTPLSLSSVPALTPYVQYIATSLQTVFPYPFPITQDSDLVVVVGGVTQPTDSGYTLSGQGNPTGGNVTFTIGQPVNTIITLFRNISIARLTQIAQNSGFSSSAFNAEFNNLYLIAQQLQESVALSLQIPNTNNPAPVTTLTPLAYANKYLTFDVNGNPQPGALVSSGSLTEALMESLYTSATPATLAPLSDATKRTAAEIAAAVTPTNYAYAPESAIRIGSKFDNSTDDTAALNNAINVAKQAINGAVGDVINLPLGTAILSSQVTLPNDVRMSGTNKNGSIFKASGAHPGPAMFNPINGASSMFDSLLQNLTINCNDVAGLSGIISDAWQENSGPRSCLIQKFRTYGIKFQNGFGGAAFASVRDTEIFAFTSGATAGIRVEQISSVGSFILTVDNTTIAGASGMPLPRGIDIVKDSTVLKAAHFEWCTSAIYIDGVGHHTLLNCSGDANTTTLVEIAATFTGTLTMIGCLRAGATNFLKDNRAGGYGTITGVDLQHLQIGTASAGVVADNTVRAWCTFDGTTTGTHAPTKGFNVASVTRNSVGNYTVTFTNPLLSADACLAVSTNLDSTDGWWFANLGFGLGTANFTIRRGGAFAGALVDLSNLTAMVVGQGIS